MIQSDPETIQSDPELMEKVLDIIKKNHKVSRKELAEMLNTSERQVRKALDALKGTRIKRKGGDSGEWEILT